MRLSKSTSDERVQDLSDWEGDRYRWKFEKNVYIPRADTEEAALGDTVVLVL